MEGCSPGHGRCPGSGCCPSTGLHIEQRISVRDFLPHLVLRQHRDGRSVKVEFPQLDNINSEDTERAIDAIAAQVEKVKSNDIGGELRKVIGDLAERFSGLHWMTVGLSIFGFIVKRADQMAGNKETCFTVLEALQNLGTNLLKTLDVLPDNKAQFEQGVVLIVEGAFFCLSQLSKNFVKRFGFVSTATSTVSALEKKIMMFTSQLILTLTTDLHKIQLPRSISYEPPADEDKVVGREEIIADIVGKILQGPTSSTQAILLYGMGGIGKTTAVNEACRRVLAAPHQTTNVVQVEVGEKPNSETLKRCLRDMCNHVSSQKHDVSISSSQEQHQNLLQRLLRTSDRRVVLFVDNIFSKRDFEKLFPKRLSLPDRTFMVVTARDGEVARVLEDRGLAYNSLRLKELLDTEAKAVLIDYLHGPPAAEEEHVKEILQLCGGWPLALRVVGCYLRGKDSLSWISAIEKLGTCKSVDGRAEDQLQQVLEWSYGELDEDCKSLFLDLSCYCRVMDWDWACALNPNVATLEDLSLIERGKVLSWDEVFGEKFDEHGDFEPRAKVQIHDRFVALGKSLSVSNPNRRIGLNWRQEPPDFLQDNRRKDECKGIVGLWDSTPNNPEGAVLAENLDAAHDTLRILYNESGVKGKCSKAMLKLQICSLWSRSPYENWLDLRDLRVLRLQYIFDPDSGYNDLHYANQVIPSKLQILQLYSIWDLACFHQDAFKNCKQLHTIQIVECNELEGLPDSICDCPLKVLDLFKNARFKSLPHRFSGLHTLQAFRFALCGVGEGGDCGFMDFSQMSQLEFLEWDNCSQMGLTGLGQSFAKLTSLQVLRIQNEQSMAVLPEGMERLSSLLVLDLDGCCNLQSLPNDISCLCTLEGLSLQGCESLEDLPNLGGLASLSLLSLPDSTEWPEWCSELTLLKRLCYGGRHIPAAFRECSSLRSLESLTLEDCASLMEFPAGLGDLSSLTSLVVRSCEQLSQLPGDICGLMCLRELELSQCRMLETLPSSFGNLSELRKLTLTECYKLQQLANTFGNLTAIQELTMTGCLMLRDIPSGFGNFLNLSKLVMTDYIALKALPDTVMNLRSIREVDITGCTSLENLPSGFGNLVELFDLKLLQCTKLQNLPQTFTELKNLRLLNMTECMALEKLPSGFGNLQALEKLKLIECSKLQELPETFTNLGSLRKLDMTGCMALEKLPSGFGNLPALEVLKLTQCSKLLELPDTFPNLGSVREVDMTGCTALENLPSGFGNLPKLQSLKLTQCSKLQDLPETFTELKNLSTLDMAWCMALEKLPSGFGNLTALQLLKLTKCSKLKALPDSICKLQHLQLLHLAGSGLQNLPKQFGQLDSLWELDLTGCSTLKELPEDVLDMKELRLVWVSADHDEDFCTSEAYRELESRRIIVFPGSQCIWLDDTLQFVQNEMVSRSTWEESKVCGVMTHN